MRWPIHVYPQWLSVEFASENYENRSTYAWGQGADIFRPFHMLYWTGSILSHADVFDWLAGYFWIFMKLQTSGEGRGDSHYKYQLQFVHWEKVYKAQDWRLCQWLMNELAEVLSCDFWHSLKFKTQNAIFHSHHVFIMINVIVCRPVESKKLSWSEHTAYVLAAWARNYTVSQKNPRHYRL